MRQADQVGPYLTESQRADLAGGDQLGHRPDGVLDRDTLIELVTVVQVDDFGASSRRRLASHAAATYSGRSPSTIPFPGIIDPHAELRCQDHVVAAAMYRSNDQLLVVAKNRDVRRRGDVSSTVHIGGVLQVDERVVTAPS
jgi:hypothetical protein